MPWWEILVDYNVDYSHEPSTAPSLFHLNTCNRPMQLQRDNGREASGGKPWDLQVVEVTVLGQNASKGHGYTTETVPPKTAAGCLSIRHMTLFTCSRQTGLAIMKCMHLVKRRAAARSEGVCNSTQTRASRAAGKALGGNETDATRLWAVSQPQTPLDLDTLPDQHPVPFCRCRLCAVRSLHSSLVAVSGKRPLRHRRAREASGHMLAPPALRPAAIHSTRPNCFPADPAGQARFTCRARRVRLVRGEK